jgi:hypothetical protein
LLGTNGTQIIAMPLNGFLGAEPPAFEPAEDRDERLNEVPS